MNYTYKHIGAIVGQLRVLRDNATFDKNCHADYNNATSYSLSRITGFSRYHIVNMLEVCLDMGLVERVERMHRNNVNKHCYFITLKGIAYVNKLKQEGLYKDSLQVLIEQKFMARQDDVVIDYEVSIMESLIELYKRELDND